MGKFLAKMRFNDTFLSIVLNSVEIRIFHFKQKSEKLFGWKFLQFDCFFFWIVNIGKPI